MFLGCYMVKKQTPPVPVTKGLVFRCATDVNFGMAVAKFGTRIYNLWH